MSSSRRRAIRGGNSLKRIAKEMVATAKTFALRIEHETGLAASSALDDFIRFSYVTVSVATEFREPGRWHNYLNNPDAMAALRREGLTEVELELPRRSKQVYIHLIRVRIFEDSDGREWFRTTAVDPPFPPATESLLTMLERVATEMGYSVIRGRIPVRLGQP